MLETFQNATQKTHERSHGLSAGACIVCGGELDRNIVNVFDTRFGIAGKYCVRQCSVCKLEQIFPVPLPADLKTFYESYYNFGGESGTVYTRLRELFFQSFLYRLWIRLDGDISFHGRPGSGSLIDIGCNEGRSLRMYAQNGFKVEGLELNEKAAMVARAANFTVHVGDVGHLRPSTLYDVAVLSNVLEHSTDPRQMLLDVHHILSQKGQVWISCPNSRSWLRRAFGTRWINWHPPFHISHFSPETLRNLLRQTGFNTIEMRQATPALWLSMSLIAKVFAKEGQPTRELRNPILIASLLCLVRSLLFPILWIQNRAGRGDCLLLIAEKD